MKTGVVMRVDGRRAVVLRADGAFVSVRAESGWRQGDVVAVPAPSRRGTGWVRTFAACLALVLLGGFGGRWLYRTPVAVISMDVNPSVELRVNRFDRVVSASALNGGGARILAAAEHENVACREALANILAAEETGGYLTAGTDVVFTVFAADAARQADLLEQVEDVVNATAALASRQADAEVHAVDGETLRCAHDHGVTAGKYLFLQQLQDLVPETDLADYRHHSIEELKGEIAACREAHGGAGESHHAAGGEGGHCG